MYTNLVVRNILTNNKGSLSVITPASKGSPRRSSRIKAGRRIQTVEEMASRLLDDSFSSLQGGEAVQIRVQAQTSTPEHNRPIRDDNAVSSITISSVARSATGFDSPRKSCRVDKQSPKRTLKAPKRSSTTRTRVDYPQRRRGAGLQRPLAPARALSVDPLRSHPPAGFGTSNSVPLSAIDGNVSSRSSDGRDASPSNANEVNRKLQAMLAATDYLKPCLPQPAPPTSKFTRMVQSKMVSRVLNRLHPKRSLEESKGRARVGISQIDTDLDPLVESERVDTPSDMNASPISTIEIRLNEGDNLNKRKVQKIVGGQVSRKPVAGDGKSLRNGKSLDDPFSGDSPQTPTSFEAFLKMQSVHDNSLCPLPLNPFESEEGFDNDIKDRILSTLPVGSSTPRSHLQRLSDPSFDESVSPKTAKLAKSHPVLSLDIPAPKVASDLLHAKNTETTAGRTNTNSAVDAVKRARTNCADEAEEIDASGPKRMKKHPSPSKEALADLEKAFRQYSQLQLAGTALGLDELATSHVTHTSSFITRDKNRLMLTRLSVTEDEDVVELSGQSPKKSHHRPISTTSPYQLSRSPRSSDKSIKVYGEIRLAPRHRHMGLFVDDRDELE